LSLGVNHMPAIIAALLSGLITIAGHVAGRVLIALGIGVVTYTGLGATTDWLTSQALSNLQALPADLLAIIAYLKVGSFINIIASAIAVRFVLQGLTGDALKQWVLK